MKERQLIARYQKTRTKLSQVIFKMPDFREQRASDSYGISWLYLDETADRWADLYDEIAANNAEYRIALEDSGTLSEDIDHDFETSDDGESLAHIVLAGYYHNRYKDLKAEFIEGWEEWYEDEDEVPEWMSTYMEFLEKITILTEVQLKAILKVGVGNSILDYHG